MTDKAIACRTPLIILGLTVLCMFASIESVHPYFFFQDDNRSQNLPYYVHNLRALANGEFPFFNFHQFLGTAAFSCMQSAALYPLNYLAALASKVLLGHYSGTMEFIALFHLLIASMGLYAYLHFLGLETSGCFFGGLTWAFCGFVVSVGNSWIMVTGIAAWLPWVLLFSTKLLFSISKGDFAILLVLRLLLLFVGHPQFFAYTMLFDLFTVLLLYAVFRCRSAGDRLARRPLGLPMSALCWLAGYVCLFIFALPLLLPVMHQVSISAARSQAMEYATYIDFSYDLLQWVHGLIMPFWDTAKVYFCNLHYISHIGYLTLGFIALALLTLRQKKFNSPVAAFTSLALFSLLWASGIFVAPVLYLVPYFNRFANPFKLGFFASFYFILVAAFGVQVACDYLRHRGMQERVIIRLTVLLLAVHAANLLFYHTVFPQKMFSRHFDRVPLEEPLQDVLRDGRIFSIGLDEHQFDGYVVYGNSVPTLGFDYATLFGLYHFGGYEVLVAEKNSRAALGLNYYSLLYARPDTVIDLSRDLSLEYLRKWGVRWYCVDRRIKVKEDGQIQLFRSDRFRNIYLDSGARPFVLWQDTLGRSGVVFSFGTNTVTIDTQRVTAGNLILNLLHTPFFAAAVDGKTAEITETEDSQLLLRIPAGKHHVTVTYHDPYFYRGCILSGGGMLFISVVYGAAAIWRKKRT